MKVNILVSLYRYFKLEAIFIFPQFLLFYFRSKICMFSFHSRNKKVRVMKQDQLFVLCNTHVKKSKFLLKYFIFNLAKRKSQIYII